MILALDLGTSKLCVAAIDPVSASLLAVCSCPNDSGVSGVPDDLHEQDPSRTRDLCFDLIRQITPDERVAGLPVDAIAFSGQMHGVVLVDRDLRPLTNLITWRDRRTARNDTPGGIAECLDLLGPDVQKRTGCQLGVGYGGATLAWLDRNGRLPAGCTALSIAGFLAAALTGIPAMDETHAASWGILDLKRNQWDSDCIQRLRLLPNVLPEIKPSAELLGTITHQAAEALGLDGRPAVCSPVGDAQASVIGAAGFSMDAIVVNLGTGGQISVPRPEYVYNKELDGWPMPFKSFLQVGAALCGGWSYAYLRQLFQVAVREFSGVDLSDEAVYERMNSLADSARPGANGLVADTRFSGTRKDESVRGSITGINTANLTPGNLSRAVIEGIVSELHSMYLASGVQGAGTLVASGNGVRRNPVLRSVIRQTFGLDCLMSRVPEEAARGAGYAAAVGLGLVSKDAATSAIWRLAEPF